MADKNDRDDNRKAMKVKWTVDNNFPELSRHLDKCLLYLAYLDMPYSNDEMVEAALQIILRTGQLTQEYQDWKEEQDQSWAAFKEWWPPNIQLRQRVSSAASKYGFGGGAAELQQMQQGVNNFINAHAQTVATMSGL